MKMLSSIFFVLFLFLFAFSLQYDKLMFKYDVIEDCYEDFTCPNTILNINNGNDFERENSIREFIKAIFTSNLLPPLSDNAQKFISCSLNHVNTTSFTLLNTLAHFAYWAFPYLLHASENLDLCEIAFIINSTVNGVTAGNKHYLGNVMINIANNMNKTCQMLEYSSLSNLGCIHVAKPSKPSKCNGHGFNYEIEQNLELFGQKLPNSLYYSVQDLYKSKNYIDKILAAAFSIAILPGSDLLNELVDINLLLEPSYMVLNNNVSACCCLERQARHNALCVQTNSTLYNNAKVLVRDIYLYEE